MTDFPIVKAEFSRMVEVTKLGKQGRLFKLSSTPAENKALSERYLILQINNLEADCQIVPLEKRRFQLSVILKAVVKQECGVSLEPVEENIAVSFSIILDNSPQEIQKNDNEIDFAMEDEDIEYFNSDEIDVGEIIAQHLSLEINPYPRKKGATGKELGKKIIKEKEAALELEKKNPFAILQSLNIKA